ncbi:MAG: hypothetical protein U0930_13630 [Pirellulales bacterium]
MTDEVSNSYASYSAPKHDGECLIVPDLASAKQRLIDSVGQSSSNSFISRWKSIAKSEIVSLACNYTSSYRDLPEFEMTIISDAQPIVLSGHQPELFHCGVWFKNFLISRLTETTGALAINFIVDNDLCRSPGIQLPTVVDHRVVSKFVAYDQALDPIPWENRKLIDRDTWQTFSSRVEQVLPNTVGQPILQQLWQYATHLDQTLPLGLLLSQSRHLLEANAGLRTIEVPLSHLCDTRSFAAFSLHLLEHAEMLRSAYNSELDSYRLAHRIRNHAQPLPNLESRDGWLEVPWWCYSGTSDRTPMYVQSRAGSLLLSDLQGWQAELTGSLDSASALDQWLAIEKRGMKIRPRALLTTMFTRLLMSDLFVHGIGGGKYDQITDRIISKIFKTTPPAMIVASATLRLKLNNVPDGLQQPIEPQIQSAERLFKSASANPELLLDHLSSLSVGHDTLQQLHASASEKRKLLASIPEKGEKWEWHVAMKKVKQQLAEQAKPILLQFEQRIDRLRELANQQALLNSREYGFCLFDLSEVKTAFGKSL